MALLAHSLDLGQDMLCFAEVAADGEVLLYRDHHRSLVAGEEVFAVVDTGHLRSSRSHRNTAVVVVAAEVVVAVGQQAVFVAGLDIPNFLRLEPDHSPVDSRHKHNHTRLAVDIHQHIHSPVLEPV